MPAGWRLLGVFLREDSQLLQLTTGIHSHAILSINSAKREMKNETSSCNEWKSRRRLLHLFHRRRRHLKAIGGKRFHT